MTRTVRPHPSVTGPQTISDRRDGCPDCTTRGILPFGVIDTGDKSEICGYWCHVCNALWLTIWWGC